MDLEAKQQELERLRLRVQQLEAEIAAVVSPPDWPPRAYYTVYHVLAGFTLGLFGAATSLLYNIVGSLLVHQQPLQLILVYLTFPLGSEALHALDSDSKLRIDGGVILAVGCCLYLATGMLLGVPFHLVLSRWYPGGSFAQRFAVVSVLALLLWLFNFYAVLSWLQPLLLGGSWIVDMIPWWVAATTHLVFGWTMLLVQPLGKFVAYRG